MDYTEQEAFWEADRTSQQFLIGLVCSQKRFG